jgi:ribosomal protein S18
MQTSKHMPSKRKQADRSAQIEVTEPSVMKRRITQSSQIQPESKTQTQNQTQKRKYDDVLSFHSFVSHCSLMDLSFTFLLFSVFQLEYFV